VFDDQQYLSSEMSASQPTSTLASSIAHLYRDKQQQIFRQMLLQRKVSAESQGGGDAVDGELEQELLALAAAGTVCSRLCQSAVVCLVVTYTCQSAVVCSNGWRWIPRTALA
jgi:hypothetical protein